MSTEESPAAEAPKKSKKKLMIMIIAAVLLLGGGGGAYFVFFAHSAEAEAEPPPEPGPVVSMDPVTVNLADGHYLRVSLALQTTLDAEEVDGAKALDLAIALYGEKKYAELATAAGRAKAKKELVAEVKEAYENQVYDIYFKEFVTQ
ncbi:hypothetical protein GCM10010124_08310 [Pilimelia terevasa]|uniref:Flagellar protein FliL n=1 Tax=Pilimelia terevasa TaxID=53372 RepID=A0A8J3BP94_9ACTN|nr:flagellar basal body-associated FliL family protein [Pilimelia terevasa]GGK18046.1 hypothetical protein GCM10010124_08310 [Pilimelia terevasa]